MKSYIHFKFVQRTLKHIIDLDETHVIFNYTKTSYIYICKNKKHIFTYIQPYTKLIYTHLQCVTLRWRFKRLLFQGSWPRNGMETSPASDDNSDDPMTWNTKSNIRIWNKTKVFEETYPTKNIHWLFKITHLETKQNKSISLRNSFFGWNIKKKL